MPDDIFDPKVMEMLDTVVAKVRGLGVEPIFLGECPNKFNDAHQDDLWYAVQAGNAVWEQSHFFQTESGAFIREGMQYSVSDSSDALIKAGAQVTSDDVTFLREQLRFLQQSGWRDLLDWKSLLALIVERNQQWLVLEGVNWGDGDVYSWDREGFFHIGKIERLDDEVGKPHLLRFKALTEANLHRLGEVGRRYFVPQIKNREEADDVAEFLWAAAEETRQVTTKPVAYLSFSDARHVRYDTERISCALLRRGESCVRRREDGEWPGFRERFGAGELLELSDVAKGLLTCLEKLVYAGWNEWITDIFGDGSTLSNPTYFVVGPEFAALVRDNAVFLIEPNELEWIGNIQIVKVYEASRIAGVCVDQIEDLVD